jgi:hypothetical protein
LMSLQALAALLLCYATMLSLYGTSQNPGSVEPSDDAVFRE